MKMLLISNRVVSRIEALFTLVERWSESAVKAGIIAIPLIVVVTACGLVSQQRWWPAGQSGVVALWLALAMVVSICSARRRWRRRISRLMRCVLAVLFGIASLMGLPIGAGPDSDLASGCLIASALAGLTQVVVFDRLAETQRRREEAEELESQHAQMREMFVAVLREELGKETTPPGASRAG